MKKLILIIALLATGCSNHSFMDRALMGYVDNHAVVLFPAGERNGVRYYRPQFQSECSYNKYYQDDSSSTGCLIRESRIADLRPYKQHVPRKGAGDYSTNHEYIEGVSDSTSLNDNI